MSSSFDLNQAFAFLLDERRSLRERMIKLYELEVAIHCCTGKYTGQGSNGGAGATETRFEIAVSALAAQARLFGIMKLLERRTTRHGGTVRGNRVRRRTRELLGMLDEAGSWKAVIDLPSPETFQQEVRNKRIDMCRASRVADFSFRVDPVSSRHPGGRTMACEIVSDERSGLFADVKSTELRAAVDRLLPVLPAALLIYREDFPYKPRELSSRRFLSSLRKAARNVDELKKFVGKYNFLVQRLRDRGYELDPITIGGKQPALEVDRPPLDQGTISLVEAYRS